MCLLDWRNVYGVTEVTSVRYLQAMRHEKKPPMVIKIAYSYSYLRVVNVRVPIYTSFISSKVFKIVRFWVRRQNF